MPAQQTVTRPYQLVVFDLDGTLTPSKSPIEPAMNDALTRLLGVLPVAVIGGGHFNQFQKQFVSHLQCSSEVLAKLHLFPTTGSAYYRFTHGDWECIYAHELSAADKERIRKAFTEALAELNYTPPEKIYGEVIEDRGNQLSFSPLGQNIVDELGERGIAMKTAWGATPWRPRITEAVARRLPDLNVKMGGLSTIDVTQKGIDKAYGLKQIAEHLHIPFAQMLFVGDAIFPGGNDFAVTETTVDYIKVAGPEQTLSIIEELIRRASSA